MLQTTLGPSCLLAAVQLPPAPTLLTTAPVGNWVDLVIEVTAD